MAMAIFFLLNFFQNSFETSWYIYVFRNCEFSCHINDKASICTAELLAIEAAIEYIWESSDEEFMVITDPLSSGS